MEIFHVPPDQVKVELERFRQDLGDISGLADSIKAKGLMTPIVLDDQLNLIAGFRRLSALKLLEWTEVPYIRFKDLDELDRREMELEENIMRKQFHFFEEQKAIVEIDRLRRLKNPDWSQDNTATVIGKGGRGRAVVSEAKTIVAIAELFPEIKTAKSKTQALSWARSKAELVTRRIAVQEAVKKGDQPTLNVASKIWLGDSVELIKTIPDESFHAIITDPPFGIDYDGLKAGSESQVSAYEDSVDSYERLLSMGPDLYRVLKPDGWLIWFLGISWYHEAKSRFREAGFVVDELPIVWDRSEGRCYTQRPDRYFTRGYDIALHCIKGAPEIIERGKPNIIRIPPVSVAERDATVERPVELYAELIRRLTVKGEKVADFFVGSGACPLAALQMGRDFFGIERDPSRHALAVSRLVANTGL